MDGGLAEGSVGAGRRTEQMHMHIRIGMLGRPAVVKSSVAVAGTWSRCT